MISRQMLFSEYVDTTRRVLTLSVSDSLSMKVHKGDRGRHIIRLTAYIKIFMLQMKLQHAVERRII